MALSFGVTQDLAISGVFYRAIRKAASVLDMRKFRPPERTSR